MALFPEDMLEELLTRYGLEELEAVRALIESRTLREAVELIVEPDGLARLFIPHFWAVYYHDGRPGFEAPGGKFLIYFANPDDDPRISDGYPVTVDDVRHLTRDEYQDGLERNEENAQRGLPPFMYVLRSVGPAGGHPFFDQLAEGAAARMDQLARASLDTYVQDNADEEGPEKRTARIRL